MDYIDEMKRDRELCLSDNTKEIEKEFVPCINCEECHFLMKPNYDFLPQACLLYAKKIKDGQTGCYGGYKKRVVSNE